MDRDKAIRAAKLTANGMDKKLLHQDGPLSIYKQYGDTYIAEHNGQRVGEMNLSPRAPYATRVEVHPNFRRMGIASKLYDVAEIDIGRKMMPSPLGLSDDATKMWKKRLNNYDDMGQRADIVREAVNVGRAAGVGKSAADRMMPFGYDPETEKVKGYSKGGALDLARAVMAKNRAGGQIAPSKYLPNVPRAVHADGGRTGYADGGSPLGLYSKAAQIIRNQPQAKGNVDQLLAMVSKAKGVKPAELANAGRPAGDTMTKEELAQHFEQALPKVDVERIGGRDSNGFPQYEDYTLPGGENYREHLLHLPENLSNQNPREIELREQQEEASKNRDYEGLDRIGAELEKIRSAKPNFRSTHWYTPNVLAHVRMDDRDNGKTLHVQEVQSDWGQEGRERGFYDPKKPIEVFHTGTGETVHATDDMGEAKAKAEQLGPQYDYGRQDDEKPPQGPYVGNTQQWTDLALKHVLTEAAKNGNYDRVVFSPGEANADLYGQRKEVGMLKFLKSKDSGEAGILSAYSKDGRRSSEHEVGSHGELAKLLGKENATNLLAQTPTPEPDNGEDVYAHRLQGPLTVGGHGMVDYYKNYVHPGALKLLQQHDPSIKPESYDLPEGYKGFSLPMTDTARQSILKNGFQAFQRGGEVHKATGGPVMGYVPTAPIQIRQLAVAPIMPQQQQQTARNFSKSLMSLMDTANEFKKKPEEPTPAPSEGHAPVQNGMSDVATAAYGKLADTWGQPIGVVSGYRDADKNQAVGGAKGSQHLHGNAYDIDTSDYSYEDRLRLADAAKAAGFTGFGFYGNNMHLDVGPQRAWGPSYHSDSIPDWAKPWVDTNIYAAQPRATGGSVSKALAITRGFTKDGKSAITALKPKGK